MMRYPTINGIAVPTREIWLPNTKLDTEEIHNRNNHHECWSARKFGSAILLKCVRDLESHQELLQKDVHNYIHANYEPPLLPTPRQAINEIERAKYYGERLHISNGQTYVYRELTDLVLSACIKNYDELSK